MPSLPKEKRAKLLSQLISHMPHIPEDWSANLLVHWVKDQTANMLAEVTDEAWVAAVWPPHQGDLEQVSLLDYVKSARL